MALPPPYPPPVFNAALDKIDLNFPETWREDLRLELQAGIKEGFAVMSGKLLQEIRVLLSLHSPEEEEEDNFSKRDVMADAQVLKPPTDEVDDIPGIRQWAGGSNASLFSKDFSDQNEVQKPVEAVKESTRQEEASHKHPSLKYSPSFATLRNSIEQDAAAADHSLFTSLHDLTYRLTKHHLESRRLASKRLSSVSDLLSKIVLRRSFTVCSSILIAFNALWMGYSIDLELAQRIASEDGHARPVRWIEAVSISFTSLFIFEVFLRMLALQRYFFIGDECYWNIFDMALVVSSIPEFFGSGANMIFLRLMRLFKLVKALRIIRLMRFVSSLREIMLSFFDTLGALFWSFVAMTLMTYMFAILFSQICGTLLEYESPPDDDLISGFSSVLRAMVSLFTSISGGQDWYQVLLIFGGGHFMAAFAKYGFALYVFFMQFGFLNVITAVFCAKAQEATQSDEDLRMQKQDERYEFVVQKVVYIFHEMNEKCDGKICREQFLNYVRSPNAFALRGMPGFQGLQYFDHNRLWELLLFSSGCPNQTVDLPGFVVAVLRMTGDAQGTESISVSQDIARVVMQASKIHRHTSRIQKHTSKIHEHTCTVHGRVSL